MVLQILIPQYKETERDIQKLLDSIKWQRNISFKDIGVIIVNDGSDIILNPYFLNSYPFKIDYIRAEHKGVSATRNRALKEATAAYVMFCDADDMFYHNLALQLIVKNAKEKQPDCIYSTFVEEVPDSQHPGNFLYNARQQAFVFVHGKVYRRQFLLEKNIWWDEELTLHEDGYFNGLALAQVPKDKLVYCNEPFYMWCNNSESVSRKTPTFVLDTYNNNLLAQDKLISKLLPVNVYEAINLTAIQLFQTYFLLTGTFLEWSNDEKQPEAFRSRLKAELGATEKRFAEFYDKFKDCYRHVIQKERERLFLSTKNSASIFNNNDSKMEDFEKWLVEFKKKHNIEFDDTAIVIPEETKKENTDVIDAEVKEVKEDAKDISENIQKETKEDSNEAKM